MKTELINEFNILQRSRANEKCHELLEEQVYTPIKKANQGVSAWITKRGQMLMHLETKVNVTMRILKKKFFKF